MVSVDYSDFDNKLCIVNYVDFSSILHVVVGTVKVKDDEITILDKGGKTMEVKINMILSIIYDVDL